MVVRRLKHFPSFSLSLFHPLLLLRILRILSEEPLLISPAWNRFVSWLAPLHPHIPYPDGVYIYIKRTIVEIGWDPAKRGFLRLGSRIESNSIGKEGEKDRFINGEMDRSIDRWSEIWKRGLALHRTRAIKDRPNFPPGFRVADRTRASCYRRYCVHEQSRN